MAQITLTIPDEKIDLVRDALIATFPVEEGFTDNQWAKESIRRWLRDLVHGYKMSTSIDALRGSTPIDNEVAS